MKYFVKLPRVEKNSIEELFATNPRLPTQDLYLKEYCRCALEAKQSDDISEFTNVHCNLTEPLIPCISRRTPLAKSLYQECHKNRRRKDVSDSNDIIENTPLSYDPAYDPTYIQPVRYSCKFIFWLCLKTRFFFKF